MLTIALDIGGDLHGSRRLRRGHGGGLSGEELHDACRSRARDSRVSGQERFGRQPSPELRSRLDHRDQHRDRADRGPHRADRHPGMRDVYRIGRGNRPEAYNIYFKRPEPYVPRHLTFEVGERAATHRHYDHDEMSNSCILGSSEAWSGGLWRGLLISRLAVRLLPHGSRMFAETCAAPSGAPSIFLGAATRAQPNDIFMSRSPSPQFVTVKQIVEDSP